MPVRSSVPGCTASFCSGHTIQYRRYNISAFCRSEFWMQEKHEAEHTKGCLCVDAMCHKTPDMKIAKCNIGAVGSIFYEITS